MKSSRNFLIQLLLSGCIWTGTTVFVQAQSSSLNLGFEQLDIQSKLPSGWEITPTPDAIIRIDSTEKHTDKYSLHIQKTLNSKKPRLTCKMAFPCSLPPGTKIEMGCYVKNKNVYSAQQIMLLGGYNNTSGGDDISLAAAPFQIFPKWEKINFKFELICPSNKLSITLSFSGSGEIWIDDIILKVNGKQVKNTEDLLLKDKEEPPYIGMDFIVSPQQPLKTTATYQRVGIGVLVDSLWSLPPDSMPCHPASFIFPGKVDSLASRIDRKILIRHKLLQNKKKSGLSESFMANSLDVWYSTSLYAAPGEKIIVTIPHRLKNKLRIRIGAQTQSLRAMSFMDWKRMPDISKEIILNDTINTLASPFGGMLYIVCPRNQASFREKIRIQGAVASPHYRYGQTSDKEWDKMLTTYGAPWGEFETNTLILTLPVSALKEIHNPRQIAHLWDQIIHSMYKLGAIPASLFYKQRVVPDLQLGGPATLAAGANGYPIKFLYNYKNKKSLEVLTTPARIGQSPPLYEARTILHELGHNVQNRNLLLHEFTEATNEMFCLYVCDQIFKSRDGISGIADPYPRDLYLIGNLTRWRENQRSLGYVIFLLLQQEFGWKPFEQFFVQSNQDSKEGLQFNDWEKVDYWVLHFSKFTKRNLVPY